MRTVVAAPLPADRPGRWRAAAPPQGARAAGPDARAGARAPADAGTGVAGASATARPAPPAAPAGAASPTGAAENWTPGDGAAHARTSDGRGADGGAAAGDRLRLDLDVLADFFGTGPAWSDPATGRYRFRVDAPAGGWLEYYVAPAERLVSLRVADGAVHALHVDLTLEAVDVISVRRGCDGEPWLETACGRGATPCTVSVTLRPDILVVLGYGRR